MDARPDFNALADELSRRLADTDWARWTDAELDRWAARAFAHQFRSCAPYRAFCERKGVTPGNVASWTGVPAVPATAFKYFDFVSGPEGDGSGPERGVSGRDRDGSGRDRDAIHGTGTTSRTGAIFRTSGTTRGSERRGRHHVPRLDLYRASLAEPFRRALLPEPDRSAVFVSLIPSPDEAPDSSLSFMVGAAAERFATTAHWLVDASGGWRTGGLEDVRESVAEARGRGAPVLLLGTALSFVHLLEGRAGAVAEALSGLPAGARAMETGGFKGARRQVTRSELHRGIEELTGIPASRIVNEYGMTELLSQLYEPVLDGGAAGHGVHVPPPWLRARALHPGTLDPLPEGEEGILAFFDLANLGSVCHVLTEDVGSVEDGRVRLRGRAEGAEPRGCSRAMDDLMSAAADGASEGR